MKTLTAAMLGATLILLGSWAGDGARAPAAEGVASMSFWEPLPTDLAPAEAGPAELTEVVQQYCTGCHGDRIQRANLSLADFAVEDAVSEAATAEKMIHKLRAGMMPPPGARRPSPDTLLALVETLEKTLDSRAASSPNPGWRTFQRLNRAEYARSVRDLLGLDIDAAAYLPPETISENFDNIADVQNLSATLLDGYMRAAAQVSRLAVGDPMASASTTTYKVPKTASQMVHVEGTPYGTRGGTSAMHNFPADGEYVFKLEFHPGPTGFLYGLTTEEPEQLEVSVDGARVAMLDIDRWMTESDPTGMKIESPAIPIRAGPHRVAAAFVRKFDAPVDDLLKPVDHTLADSQIGSAYGVTTLPHLRDMGITGPYNVTGVSDTPSRQRIFTCRPMSKAEERPCATAILRRIGTEAYRRPLTDDDVADLLRFYDEGVGQGGFEVGIRTGIQALLASPHFLFRVEGAPSGVAPGETYRISDNDMASRLSFFLWALPPDDQLLELARRGKLSKSEEIEKQARRMLADPRSEALATRFASQWLRLQDLEKLHPDAQLYPYYDRQLAEAMERETELFFYNLVKEDRSLLELLDADYTFVNERLARHYGIPGVTGDEMRRVSLASQPFRRGLLGHGSVLAMTSHADRTSPVLRGKWIMEVLLGSPPPPPPPDVPDLEDTESASDGRALTTRERMEAHRASPSCMSCHKVIDPLGLALDNFDVTGAWRIKENGMPIDATGELYDGTKLTNPQDLRQALLGRPTPFVRTFTKNLMAYALGRRAEYFDMPTVRGIERDAAKNGYRMSSFVLGVVTSPAFRMSRAEAVADDEVENR